MTGWLKAFAADGDPFPSESPDVWMFAVLPDTQIYVRSYPELFEAQTRWIAENAARYRILFVLHEGDIVHDNSAEQWKIAARAIRLLDGRVPYVLALGNHDYGEGGSANNRGTRFHDFFRVDEQRAWPSFGGVFEEGRLDNVYHVFETPGGAWIVLALEFGPRDEVVAWADAVLAAHPSVPAILLTHAYTYFDSTRYDRRARPDQKWSPHEYGIAKQPGGVNDGEALFSRLVARRPSVQLVLSGHVLENGTGLITSAQDGGSVVHQMLANYQNRARGGDGYLRLVEIDAALERIRVRTFSPVVNAYRVAPDDELDLILPELRPAAPW